jgi:uncharacterized LabA/DUF88 family protein
MNIERVISYIDGFNLYFGLKEAGWKRYYWVDIKKLVTRLLKENQQLIITKYFTARISGPPDKQKRQSIFLEALSTLTDFNIYYGHYLSSTITCNRCGRNWRDFEEKMTDVNIATEILTDAFEDKFDTAILISADSDLVPPIRTIKRIYPRKRIVVFFPPKRFSTHLKNSADIQLSIGRGSLVKSQFPDRIRKPDGVILEKPLEWR